MGRAPNAPARLKDQQRFGARTYRSRWTPLHPNRAEAKAEAEADSYDERGPGNNGALRHAMNDQQRFKMGCQQRMDSRDRQHSSREHMANISSDPEVLGGNGEHGGGRRSNGDVLKVGGTGRLELNTAMATATNGETDGRCMYKLCTARGR